ncbi:hypothetical protein BOX15_Mlig027959g1, partial [Macrostomum lignano]
SPAEQQPQQQQRPQFQQPVSLSDFFLQLDEYQPTIPDRVTQYYLERSGLEVADQRLLRLVSLAGQKFISDIVSDAMHHCRARQGGPAAKRASGGTPGAAAAGTASAAPGAAGAAGSAAAGGGGSSGQPGKRLTLTMEDLGPAFQECGINVQRPPYFT